MLVQADLALYRAKEDGRNCYRFHSPELDREVLDAACGQLRSWRDEGIVLEEITINLSLGQLKHGRELVDSIEAAAIFNAPTNIGDRRGVGAEGRGQQWLGMVHGISVPGPGR